MINEIVSFVLIVGGMKLLFETRKKYNIYLAIGFILYGLHFLLNIFTMEDELIQLVFNIPKLLGSLCLFISPLYYISGEKK